MEVPIERDDCLAMIWPPGNLPKKIDLDSRYSVRIGRSEPDFTSVQRAIGFEVKELHWKEIIRTVSDGHMVFAVHESSPVGVAVAQARSFGAFELSWVAVARSHQGRGLGQAICSALVQHLVATDSPIFLNTQDNRLAAIRTYFNVGFHPIFRPAKIDRWRETCSRISLPFAPSNWKWPVSAQG